MNRDPQCDQSVETLLKHHDWLRNLAQRMVLDADAAEDLTQDTWLAALNKPPALGGRERAWLSTVFRNRRIQRWRSAARRKERTMGLFDAMPEPEQINPTGATRQRVWEAVELLPGPQRCVILLAFEQGLSCSEIAKRLGEPKSCIEKRRGAGLATLRRLLENRFEITSSDLAAFVAPGSGALANSNWMIFQALKRSKSYLFSIQFKSIAPIAGILAAFAVVLLGTRTEAFPNVDAALRTARLFEPVEDQGDLYATYAQVEARSRIEADTGTNNAEEPKISSFEHWSATLDSLEKPKPVLLNITDQNGNPISNVRFVDSYRFQTVASISENGRMRLEPIRMPGSLRQEILILHENSIVQSLEVEFDIEGREYDVELPMYRRITGRIMCESDLNEADVLIGIGDAEGVVEIESNYSEYYDVPFTELLKDARLDAIAPIEPDGSFTFNCVNSGAKRLFARSKSGRLRAFSQPIHVYGAGFEYPAQQLRLLSALDHRCISGRVFDPLAMVAGEGIPEQELITAEFPASMFSWPGEGGSHLPKVRAIGTQDEQQLILSGSGEFLYIAPPQERGPICFVAEHHRLGRRDIGGTIQGYLYDVELGAHSLSIPLHRTNRVPFVVSDEKGDPMDQWSYSIVSFLRPAPHHFGAFEQGRIRGKYTIDKLSSDISMLSVKSRDWELFEKGVGVGHAPPVLELPYLACDVYISAPGYRIEHIGPLWPERMSKSIAVSLKRLPELRGRVSADGAPLPAAMVRLHRFCDSGDDLWLDATFATNVEVLPFSSTQTDAHGEFVLPFEFETEFILRVEKDEYAASSRRIGRTSRFEDLPNFQIQMKSGPQLEYGPIPKSDNCSQAVLATDGSPWPRIAAVEGDGSVTFKNMPEGNWEFTLLPGNSKLYNDSIHVERLRNSWPSHSVVENIGSAQVPPQIEH